MPDDSQDAWVGELLRSHAARGDVDLRAFTERVLNEVDAPARPRRPGAWRGRFPPVLVAAAAVAAVAVASSVLSDIAGRDDRGGQSAAAAPSGPSTAAAPSGSVSLPTTIGEPTAVSAPVTSAGPPARSEPTRGAASLPSTFEWGSATTVLPPRWGPDGLIAFKDPTAVRFGGFWHVFVTTVKPIGYGLGYLRFADWSQAASAPLHDLASSSIGPGFRATPQVFWFAPQKLWYLVYQTGQASYSTNPDINDPDGWSAPESFYRGVPDLVREHVPPGGYWVGMWVSCDDVSCYLFSSDSRGHLFRSRTSAADFPGGMSPPVIAAQSDGGTTFAADRVYKVAGASKYLLLAQAFGPDGRGYLRSWTSPRIDGRWVPLADTPANPFVGRSNVATATAPWTASVLHGELLRDGYDQTLTVSPCRLQLLALGLDERHHDDSAFQIGLLTQANPTCRQGG